MIALSVTGDASEATGLEDDAQRLLELLERGSAELSLVLCDDAFIQPLNAQWRNKDAATDVLSFPQDDPRLLGDVVISVETAARQAHELGHPLSAELRVLLVHGVLHLLGHDHHDPGTAERMRGEEARLLDALGVPGGAGLVERVRPHG